ncbi:MAG: hypothetical protein CM15mP119_2330 [Alphaproteobacteria bacterium]|nr:MAG: hypothetical protein CM15mP119_2330 [Alphaproteobacteria bacterium]
MSLFSALDNLPACLREDKKGQAFSDTQARLCWLLSFGCEQIMVWQSNIHDAKLRAFSCKASFQTHILVRNNERYSDPDRQYC